MKICYVLATGNPGGAEIQSSRLIAQMRKRGIDARLALYYGFGEMPGNIRAFVEAEEIPCLDMAKFSGPQKSTVMREWFQMVQPDAVIACGYPTGLITSMVASEVGVPVRIIRLESCGHVREQFPQLPAVEQMGMTCATHVVGNSEAVRQSVTKYHGGDLAKAHVVPNGVTIPPLISPALRREAREYWGLKPENICVGLLANYRADGLKNQKMLVRAAEQVLRQVPYARFVMAGYHSPYADQVISEIDRRGLREYVKALGRLDDLNMLAGWDVAVNCSYTEGLSNAVMECMSYGLPVVLTDTDGNRDLARHWGVLAVDVDDDTQMARLLTGIICNSQYRILGASARKAIEENYSWERVIDQWLQLLT